MNRNVALAVIAIAVLAGIAAFVAITSPRPNSPRIEGPAASSRNTSCVTNSLKKPLVSLMDQSSGGDRDPNGGVERDSSASSRSLDLDLYIHMKLADGASVFVQGELIEIELLITNRSAERDYLRNRDKTRSQLAVTATDGKAAQSAKYVAPPELVLKLPKQGSGWVGSVSLQLTKKGVEGKSDEEIWPGKDWNGLLVSDRQQLETMTEIAERPLFAIWCLKSEQTRSLVPGQYELVARYDAAKSNDGQPPRDSCVTRREFRIMADNNEDKELRSFYEMSRFHVKAGKPDAAIRYAKMSIAKDPAFEGYQAYLRLGEAYEMKGMRDEAIASYEEFLKQTANTKNPKETEPIEAKVSRLREKKEGGAK